jgi:hypothetical protein
VLFTWRCLLVCARGSVKDAFYQTVDITSYTVCISISLSPAQSTLLLSPASFCLNDAPELYEMDGLDVILNIRLVSSAPTRRVLSCVCV